MSTTSPCPIDCNAGYNDLDPLQWVRGWSGRHRGGGGRGGGGSGGGGGGLVGGAGGGPRRRPRGEGT
eukprot:8105733-Pyramimonas_sp.AAC.1